MSRYINPVPQYSDGAGNPLVDGKVYFFESGTSTPKTTYADVNQTIPNTHPVLLDGAGRVPNIFFTGVARARLTDVDDVQIWDKDPVGAPGLGGDFEEWVPQVTYNTNDIVEGSDGKFYISFEDGNLNNDPTTSPQFWQEIEFINVWNEFVTYELGAIVKASDNNFYKSLIDDNINNDPVSSPSEWGSPIVQDLSNPGPIGDGTPDTGVFTGLKLASISGILEDNAGMVSTAIFGAALDVVNWVPLVDAPVAQLMLATGENTGGSAIIKIWDLSAPDFDNTTPLATVTLAGNITISKIAAISCYIYVATDSGLRVVSPHNSTWQELTTGWPQSLTADTEPALAVNTVASVGVGYSNTRISDPRTGGFIPTAAITYSTGADAGAVIKDNATVFNLAGTLNSGGAVVVNGRVGISDTGSGNRLTLSQDPVEAILADDWAISDMGGTNSANVPGLGFNGSADSWGNLIAGASSGGFTLIKTLSESISGDLSLEPGSSVKITSVFNTGYMGTSPVAAWIANSTIDDRSGNGNTLTENGTVTEAPFSTGSELRGYSNWAGVNNLTRGSDPDWDVIGLGPIRASGWFQSSGAVAIEHYIGFANAGNTVQFLVRMLADGTITGTDDGATASVVIASTKSYDDNVPHRFDFVRVSSTERHLYIDGILVASSLLDAGSISDSGNLPFAIGVNPDGTTEPATSSTFALFRMDASIPTAALISSDYEDEVRLPTADTLCLLQAGINAAISVNIDQATGKTIVTQADETMIFQGLAIDSVPTLPTGATAWRDSDLWSEVRGTVTDANAFALSDEKDVRGALEDIDGIKAAVAAASRLGEAKALLNLTPTLLINAQLNIKSVTSGGVGISIIKWAVPFISDEYFIFPSVGLPGTDGFIVTVDSNATDRFGCTTRTTDDAGTPANSTRLYVSAHGELDQ